MKTLTDIFLEKSFKYIRKFRKNGRWNYVYEEPHYQPQSNFGEIFDGYKGDSVGAIRKLLKEKSGQCSDVVTAMMPVLYRGKNGKIQVQKEGGKPVLIPTSIDYVYGDENKGMKHIIDKHFIYHDDYHTIDQLSNAVEYSLKNVSDAEIQISKHSRFKFRTVDNKGNRVVVGVEIVKTKRGDMIRHFVLTSYDTVNDEVSKVITDAKEIERRKREVDEWSR